MTSAADGTPARRAAAVLALVRRAAAVERKDAPEAVRALERAREGLERVAGVLDAAARVELVESIAAALPETFAHPDAGAAGLELQIACHEALGSRETLPDLLVALAYLHSYRRRPEAAADVAARAQALLGPAAPGPLGFHILRFLAAAGRWTPAFRLAAAMRPPAVPVQRLQHLALAARAAAGLGLNDEAEARLAAAGELLRRLPPGPMRSVGTAALLKASTEVRLARGDTARARESAAALVEFLDRGTPDLHEEERLDALTQAGDDLRRIALNEGRGEEAAAWQRRRDRAEARLRAVRGLHLRLVASASGPGTPVP